MATPVTAQPPVSPSVERTEGNERRERRDRPAATRRRPRAAITDDEVDVDLPPAPRGRLDVVA